MDGDNKFDKQYASLFKHQIFYLNLKIKKKCYDFLIEEINAWVLTFLSFISFKSLIDNSNEIKKLITLY